MLISVVVFSDLGNCCFFLKVKGVLQFLQKSTLAVYCSIEKDLLVRHIFVNSEENNLHLPKLFH